jgi:SAM-dependent methyltransferase
MTLINHILATLCGWLLLWNAYILIWNKGIPNIRTAPAIRKRIIEVLRADQAAREKMPYVVIDLGSGNGLFTREIARALPEAHVIGIEISALAYRWSLFFQRLCGLKNIEYRRADFNAVNLGEADAVVMFLHVYFMEAIGKKLHAELKPGTLATANKFPLRDGWEPVETIEVKTLYPHQKMLYVYRQE